MNRNREKKHVASRERNFKIADRINKQFGYCFFSVSISEYDVTFMCDYDDVIAKKLYDLAFIYTRQIKFDDGGKSLLFSNGNVKVYLVMCE